MMTEETLTALRNRYAEPEIPKCNICGGELSIQRSGGGSPTIWACSGMIDDPTGERTWIYAEGRSMADDHYERSRWTDYRRGGDSDVIDLLNAYQSLNSQPASPALKLPWSEKTCRECGCNSLSWGFAIINKSTVQNGLLRISDVDGLFYLGCDECSETVTQVSPDEVVELLSALQKSINAPHAAPIDPICATGGAEWVKCSARLPEVNEEVIAFIAQSHEYKGKAFPGVRYEEYWWLDGEMYSYDEVSHWQPMPAAPVE